MFSTSKKRRCSTWQEFKNIKIIHCEVEYVEHLYIYIYIQCPSISNLCGEHSNVGNQFSYQTHQTHVMFLGIYDFIAARHTDIQYTHDLQSTYSICIGYAHRIISHSYIISVDVNNLTNDRVYIIYIYVYIHFLPSSNVWVNCSNSLTWIKALCGCYIYIYEYSFLYVCINVFL